MKINIRKQLPEGWICISETGEMKKMGWYYEKLMISCSNDNFKTNFKIHASCSESQDPSLRRTSDVDDIILEYEEKTDLYIGTGCKMKKSNS